MIKTVIKKAVKNFVVVVNDLEESFYSMGTLLLLFAPAHLVRNTLMDRSLQTGRAGGAEARVAGEPC